MGNENQNNYWNNTYGYPYMYNTYQGMYDQNGMYNPQYMNNPQMLYGQGGFAPWITQESISEYLAGQGSANPQSSNTDSSTQTSSTDKAKTKADRYGKTPTTPVIEAISPKEKEEEKGAIETWGSNFVEGWKKEEELTIREYKKEPWYSGKRVGRAVKNVGKGIGKTLLGFVGFENGKFNGKKCLRNLGTAAAIAGLSCIPYVGPVIAYGAVATGLVAGGISVGKGISKASKANTLEELDHAWEDIGAGGLMVVGSAAGLKKMGSSFRVQNPKGYKVMKKGTSPKTVKETGNVIEASSDHWLADMTVNAFKGTKARMNADKVSCIENGYGRTAWAKLRGKPIQKYKTDAEFKAELNKAKGDLTKEITKIDRKISSASTEQEKYVYQQIKASLEKQRNSLDSIETREQFIKLQETAINTADDIANLSEIQSHCGRRKGWKVTLEDGTKVTFKKGDKKLIENAIDEITATRDAFGKTVSKLTDSRHESMLNMARTPGRKGSTTRNNLEKYFGEEKGKLGFKKLAEAELKSNAEPTLFKQVFGFDHWIIKTMFAPVLPYGYGALSGTNSLYNWMEVINPTYGQVVPDSMKNIFASTSEYLEGFSKEETTNTDATSTAGTTNNTTNADTTSTSTMDMNG